MSQKECQVCGVQHDDEIHTSTERIHQWLRDNIEMKLRPIVAPVTPDKGKRQPRKKAA